MRFEEQRQLLRELKREFRRYRRRLTLRHLRTRLRFDVRPRHDEYGVNLDREELRKALRDREEERRS